MDELKMDGLELPDTGETYDDLPDASEGLEETAQEAPRPSDSMDNFDDIAMPVLSEMDGSDIASPSEQAAKSASPDKPAQPKPMFEDMSAPVRPQTTQQSTSSGQSTYQSTSGSYQSTSGTYQNSSAPSYADTSQSNTYTNTFDALQQERMEIIAKGRKRAKFTGILAIVLDVLETLFMLSLRNIIVTVVRIIFIVKFMNGSSSSRMYTALISVIRIIMNIISIGQVDSMSAEFAQYGLSIVITITQLILFIGIFINCVVIYFTMFDKCVKEYTVDR